MGSGAILFSLYKIAKKAVYSLIKYLTVGLKLFCLFWDY